MGGRSTLLSKLTTATENEKFTEPEKLSAGKVGG